MKDLIPFLKSIEIEQRSHGKLSYSSYEKLSNLNDWETKTVQSFLTEVQIAINKNDLNFVFKRYVDATHEPLSGLFRKNKDLLIVCLKRDERDTVLTDVINRLVIPEGVTWEHLEIWGMKVEQARNFAIEQAMKLRVKYLLFIDDDMLVENTGLVKLWETAQITNCITCAADYQKKADHPITAHGKFILTDQENLVMTDLCAMGFTLINIERLTYEVPAPYFWVFLALDGLWDIGEDAYYTRNVLNHTGELAYIRKDISVLHYDKLWKRCFGKRDKTVTYATPSINNYDSFERLRVPPQFPLVAICTPTRTENDAFATNLDSLLMLRGYRSEFLTVHGLHVDDARNQLAINAVKMGAEYLFFIDNDVIVPQDGLVQLLEIMEKDKDHEIGAVSGDYLLKGKVSHSAHLQLNENGMVTELNRIPDLPSNISANWLIGMGCCLIRCEVFRQAVFPWFLCYSTNAKNVGVHESEQGGVNEDAQFTELVFQSGYKIKILRDLKCIHVDFKTADMYGYDGNFDANKFACFPWVEQAHYVGLNLKE